MLLQNLLIIAGTGTKSGKTSMACRIIEQLPDLKITAIKITPHFHETTSGLIPKVEQNGYSIYEETDVISTKDTSRMLRAGATKVLFAKVWDEQLLNVFNEIIKDIPEGSPIICESPALRYFVEPGLFIIMTSDTVNKQKNINNLQRLHHVMLKYEDIKENNFPPVAFKDGKWCYK